MKPSVNLLDTQFEPSDEALDAIMQSLIADVKERSEMADRQLRARMERETAAAISAYARRETSSERPA
ncbi:MAG: hypothetical protein FWD57_07655 [Polyangiaceae bacterium]|nr:hypothetical protein [Polyangiaceae bacterium]